VIDDLLVLIDDQNDFGQKVKDPAIFGVMNDHLESLSALENTATLRDWQDLERRERRDLRSAESARRRSPIREGLGDYEG
jgi:hypothetical protein